MSPDDATTPALGWRQRALLAELLAIPGVTVAEALDAVTTLPARHYRNRGACRPAHGHPPHRATRRGRFRRTRR